MGNNQVWEIIKDFNCADLKIVFDPAVAVWKHQQSKIEQLEREKAELQAKIDDVLKHLEGESSDKWGLWKEKADMFDQGASDAFEQSYWIVKKALRGDSCE